MTGPLTGHVALVTGAAQGMGAAHARRLAHDGAVVAVNDRVASDALNALAKEIGGIACPGDLSYPAAVDDVVRQASEVIGPIDILVANHAYMAMANFLHHNPEDWWRIIDTNLTGTFGLIQAVLPGMRTLGAGRIVIISSEWGVTGWPGATAYTASKAGLISLTKTLGRELAPSGIVVNAIAPGVTDTPQLQVDADAAGLSLEQMHAEYAGDIPAGRIGKPEEISAIVALLADFRLGSLIGQVVQVNGGTTRTRV